MITTTLRNMNENSARNFHMQTTSKGNMELDLYFSYETIVAFRLYMPNQYEFEICQNEWTNTTGKHLNWIDTDKSKRIPMEEFTEKLNKAYDSFYNADDDFLAGFKDSEEYQNAMYIYLQKNRLITN